MSPPDNSENPAFDEHFGDSDADEREIRIWKEHWPQVENWDFLKAVGPIYYSVFTVLI